MGASPTCRLRRCCEPIRRRPRSWRWCLRRRRPGCGRACAGAAGRRQRRRGGRARGGCDGAERPWRPPGAGAAHGSCRDRGRRRLGLPLRPDPGLCAHRVRAQRALAVLRACGASWTGLARVLMGAALALVLPAAALGVPLERYVFGPALSRLAESYAVLPLASSWPTVAVVLAGLALAAAITVVWVALSTARAPVVEGLAER